MKLASLLALTGLMAASGAQAFDWSDMYIGGNVGRATAEIPSTINAFSPPQAVDVLSKSANSTSFKLFAGSQVMDYLAIEGGYANLGKFSALRTTTTGTSSSAGKTQGVFADIVGMAPLGESFKLLGRLGYGFYWNSVSNVATGAVTLVTGGQSYNDSAIVKGFQYGIGMQLDIGKNVGVRAELDWKPRSYASNGSDFGSRTASLGLIYKF